jgi:hypothetical protein
MTRLGCHRFGAHEVRLWLSLIAYDLGNLWRRLVLPARIDRSSLASRAAAPYLTSVTPYALRSASSYTPPIRLATAAPRSFAAYFE